MNIPNLLSVSRIVIAPFVIFALLSDRTTLVLVLIVYALLSDLVDGYLARTFKQQSYSGLVLDPLADKIFFGSILLTMAFTYEFPLWVILLLLVRDLWIGVEILRIYEKKKKITGKPELISKINTVILFITLISFVLEWSIREFLVILVAIFTFLSGIIYFYKMYIVKVYRAVPSKGQSF